MSTTKGVLLSAAIILMAVVAWAASGDWFSVSSSTGTTGWANGGNIYTSNDTRASDVSGSGVLHAENPNPSVPAGSTIDSIILSVEGYAESSLSPRRQYTAQLTKNGSAGVGDAISNNELPQGSGSEAYIETRGTTNSLWGTTWTVAEVNASTFGALITTESGKSDSMLVDHVRLQLWWTEGGTGKVVQATNVTIID